MAHNPRDVDKKNTRQELRERLVEYYKHTAPEKADLVDELVALRFSESTIMTALSAKYGVDPAVDSRQVPRMQLNSLVNLDLWDDSRGPKEQSDGGAAATAAAKSATAGRSGRHRHDSGGGDAGDAAEDGGSTGKRGKAHYDAAEAEALAARRVPPGGPMTSQLILAHLRAVGLASVADMMASELRGAAVPSTFFKKEEAPVQIDDMQSCLSALLCPATNSRFFISRLLRDLDVKRLSSFEGRQHDSATARALDAMAVDPMWADLNFARTRRRMYLGSGGSPVPRAAPLNQLVELMTSVTIRPHVSIPESVENAIDQLTTRLLATHRHFVPTHVLLSKLFERFFVPANLPLSHKYDANGIVIDAPRSDRRTLITTADEAESNEKSRFDYLKQATRTIHIKVFGVIFTWLDSFPRNFDNVMIAAIAAFVDEVAYTPTVWSANAAPSELMQIAEHVKERINRRLAAIEAEDSAGGDPRHHRDPVADALQPDSMAGRATSQWAPGIGHGLTTSSVSDAEAREVATLLFATSAPDSGKGSRGQPSSLGGAGSSARAAALKRQTSTVVAPSGLLASRGADGMSSSAANAAGAAAAASSNGTSAAGPSSGSFLVRVDELRLANQLTAIDHRLFRGIDAGDLYVFTTVASSSMFHSSRTPAANLLAMVKAGEALLLWSVTEVLLAAPAPSAAHNTGGGGNSGGSTEDRGGALSAESTATARAQVIAKLVALAFRLVEINNLHGAFHVYAALRHPVVTRLAATWALVSVQTIGALDELHRIFAFERGYRGYHEYVASVPDDDVYPLIPLLAVAVDDVRRLMAGEPTVLRDAVGSTVLHWRKFDALGTVYERIRRLQQAEVPAEFVVLPDCLEWLRQSFAQALTHPDELVAASFTAEPESEPTAAAAATQ